MLEGTVALSYMNTNVVYFFFRQTQIRFRTEYLFLLQEKFPTQSPKYTWNKQS